MRDITRYYGGRKEEDQAKRSDDQKQPEQRKGMWVYEYENRILGLVGIDGTKPGQRLETIMDQIDILRAKKEAKLRKEMGNY